eukprot:jgi/Antlo1/1565/1682
MVVQRCRVFPGSRSSVIRHIQRSLRLTRLGEGEKLHCTASNAIFTILFYHLAHVSFLFFLKLVSSITSISKWLGKFLVVSALFFPVLVFTYLTMGLLLHLYLRPQVSFGECLYIAVLSNVYSPILSVLIGFGYIGGGFLSLVCLLFLFIANWLAYSNICQEKGNEEDAFRTMVVLMVINAVLMVSVVLFFNLLHDYN